MNRGRQCDDLESSSRAQPRDLLTPAISLGGPSTALGMTRDLLCGTVHYSPMYRLQKVSLRLIVEGSSRIKYFQSSFRTLDGNLKTRPVGHICYELKANDRLPKFNELLKS